MVNIVLIFAMHDSDKKNFPGTHLIAERDAHEWNKKGFGIFHTVQSFKTVHRRKEELIGINAWAVDLDEGTKDEQLDAIAQGLPPTMLIETKNGHQVYWACGEKDVARSLHTWDVIIKNRLIPFYKGDKRAADVARLMRRPGYYHLKDPSDPFLVKKIYSNKNLYTCDDMLFFYDDLLERKERKKEIKRLMVDSGQGIGFWDKLYHADQGELLLRLSMSEHVRGEVFDFKPNSNGNSNIFVNGKSTSCFIDRNHRIGSMDGGGPTVFQWLKWYGHDSANAINIIKAIAPELGE